MRGITAVTGLAFAWPRDGAMRAEDGDLVTAGLREIIVAGLNSFQGFALHHSGSLLLHLIKLNLPASHVVGLEVQNCLTVDCPRASELTCEAQSIDALTLVNLL